MRFICHRLGLLLAILSWFELKLSAQQYWSQVANSPAGTTRHDDVYFIDQYTGWATKSSLIYKTTNGGNDWVQKFALAGTHFRSIGFASATRGWAGNLGPGSYDGTITNTNVFYETFDGGDTWSVVPHFNETGMKGFCALHVLDANHIYGGGRVRGPAYFCKTENAGTNWSIVNLTAQGVMGGIMDVYFKDPANGFVVGMDTNAYASCPANYHGRIARTTDGGQTWTPQVTTTLSCCYFWKMSWPTPDIGYVSLQRNPTSSDFIVFYKTTDGGANWSSNGVPVSAFGNTQFYWQGIGFVSANEGWAGGESSASPYANTFIHTLDGGATWSPVGYTNSRSINRIRFISPVLGHASGQKLHIYRSPLAITAQPREAAAQAGTTSHFSIAVWGDAPISFQWRKDSEPLPGATNATLTLTNLTRAQSGFYSVVVTNAGAALVSSNAWLHVSSPSRFDVPEQISATLQLSFHDGAGAAFTTNDTSYFSIETSSNLVEWLPWTNGLSLTNGRVRFNDTWERPQKFYRVLEH